MASGSFKNEDPTVLRSVRITVQVRKDKVTLDIRSDKGVMYPAIVVASREASRNPEADTTTSTMVALAKANEILMGFLDEAEASKGERW